MRDLSALSALAQPTAFYRTLHACVHGLLSERRARARSAAIDAALHASRSPVPVLVLGVYLPASFA
ncbi:hypothetical protein BV25DRAFT_1821214 [Artomyces pyxidatus]|uniref:Uncharacterized protein n=1 Tax=Artomyces pyxidatus TaxID=48021 RepID=A0ACB8TD57_9AGAM|nr:hypothetical protein BV25DRAFT_1821214 [Artomyces pyxidatus]